jgi:transcription antitermination factor NusG
MFWIAVTKPSGENRAMLNLTRQGFIPYLPRYISRVGKETKIKILFPRYIFIEAGQQWHMINSTFGINRLILSNDGKPAMVSDKVISDLKMREDNKGLISLPEPPKFRSGEKVAVVKGPLQGYTGLFDGMRPNERVRVLIEMLGQTVPIEIAETDLSAVASSDGSNSETLK